MVTVDDTLQVGGVELRRLGEAPHAVHPRRGPAARIDRDLNPCKPGPRISSSGSRCSSGRKQVDANPEVRASRGLPPQDWIP